MLPQDAARIATLQAAHPNARLFQAPGRVNLLGEHTDYSGGFCLPAPSPSTPSSPPPPAPTAN